MNPRPRSKRALYLIAAASTVLAIGVRLYWVFRVQSPLDFVYSDMAGYVVRAKALLDGTTTSYPRLDALYPYGAHYFFAAELGVLGRENRVAINIAHALLCGAPAWFFVLFASRFFKRTWPTALLGVMFAVWHPIIWCAGYFVSEVPFMALLFLNAWLCLRFAETKRGGIALGVTSAMLFAIRPQFILTFAVLAVVYLWNERRRRRGLFRRTQLWRCVRVLVPWIAVLAFSIVRFHRLTGNWGLISENGQLNRLFADTNIGSIESRWKAPNGQDWYLWVEPPAKKKLGESENLTLNQYFGDPNVVGPIRRERVRAMTVSYRIRRAARNVQLLWGPVLGPWPEDNQATSGLRRLLQINCQKWTRILLVPIATIGIALSRRHAGYVIVLAHLATLVMLAILFFPESRYRVPYDPFMMLLALAGIARLAPRLWLLRQTVRLGSGRQHG